MTNFLGWARGINGYGDETGVWHALITVQTEHGDAAHAACSRVQRTAGQTEPLPVGARICQRVGCDNVRRRVRS